MSRKQALPPVLSSETACNAPTPTEDVIVTEKLQTLVQRLGNLESFMHRKLSSVCTSSPRDCEVSVVQPKCGTALFNGLETKVIQANEILDNIEEILHTVSLTGFD